MPAEPALSTADIAEDATLIRQRIRALRAYKCETLGIEDKQGRMFGDFLAYSSHPSSHFSHEEFGERLATQRRMSDDIALGLFRLHSLSGLQGEVPAPITVMAKTMLHVLAEEAEDLAISPYDRTIVAVGGEIARERGIGHSLPAIAGFYNAQQAQITEAARLPRAQEPARANISSGFVERLRNLSSGRANQR